MFTSFIDAVVISDNSEKYVTVSFKMFALITEL